MSNLSYGSRLSEKAELDDRNWAASERSDGLGLRATHLAQELFADGSEGDQCLRDLARKKSSLQKARQRLTDLVAEAVLQF